LTEKTSVHFGGNHRSNYDISDFRNHSVYLPSIRPSAIVSVV